MRPACRQPDQQKLSDFQGQKKGSSRNFGEAPIDTGLANLCFLIAALSVSESGSLTCRTRVLVSPLTGESLSLACPRESNQREGHPTIRPRLRRGSLLPSPLQGHATKGHPWPIVALATSMSLNPLRGDPTRPPEGGLGVVCTIVVQEQKQKTRRLRTRFSGNLASLRPCPVRRLSVGVAQGDEPYGCGEILTAAPLNGPGMALVSRPPERHRSEGS